MYTENKILIGTGNDPAYLLPQMANRHGLIAGATGTGKTTTLKVMAESFSAMGVPVFLADVKGDLASLSVPGEDSPKLQERLRLLNMGQVAFKAFPVELWDIFGEGGHRIRTTISDMGPFLLSRILGLNDTQTGVLTVVFRIADDKGHLLLDLKDLKAMVQYVGENSKEYITDYGNIAPQTIGTIIRNILSLEEQGGEFFFGEPILDFYDWIKTSANGLGIINILHCVKLFQYPRLYSTFLLWMLSELYELLPEVGDLDMPKMVFFFDEAHLLFADAPKVLLEKIELVVKLVRSKGVGVYFISQNPADLPQSVLGQLGNRVQHALRGFTPAEEKMIKAAAETFRPNPSFETRQVLTELATGEALVSCLQDDGSPGIVQRVFIVPPQSRFGTIDDQVRTSIINSSLLNGKYNREIDRESAFESLASENSEKDQRELAEKNRLEQEKETVRIEKENKRLEKSAGKPKATPFDKVASSALSTIGREVGRTLIRGILGSLIK